MSDTNPLANFDLGDIQKNMEKMQQQMQSTYGNLESIEIRGESGGITITITCTYKFVDIDIQPSAMQGGMKVFKENIREAWNKACEAAQKTTQSKTMELLKTMNVPDDLRKRIEEDSEES